MKFINYLNEAKKFVVTIKDIEKIYNSERSFYSEIKFNSKMLVDYWKENKKKDVYFYLNLLSNIGNNVVSVVEKKLGYLLPYYDKKALITNLLNIEMLPNKDEFYYPVSIYVSGNKNDKMTIGLLVYTKRKNWRIWR